VTTAAEKRHMDRVAQLPCMVCGSAPVEIHHIREGQGMSQRASNWLTVPLCPSCHRGPNGIHGDKSMMRIHKLEELDLLALTIKAVTC
jgi:hypothetical protein